MINAKYIYMVNFLFCYFPFQQKAKAKDMSKFSYISFVRCLYLFANELFMLISCFDYAIFLVINDDIYEHLPFNLDERFSISCVSTN